jgi:hypothetical protein
MNNQIPLAPCDSSNVAAWGHDGATLAVQFKSGSTYHYAGVPADLIEQMRQPGVSIGSFVSKNIRGQYEGVRQDLPEESVDG